MPRDTNTPTDRPLRVADPPPVNSPAIDESTYDGAPPISDSDYEGTYDQETTEEDEARIASETTAKERHPASRAISSVKDVTVMPEQLEGAGAQVALRSVFSRTISEPDKSFGSITAGFEMTETFPGTMSPQEIAEVATEQFILLKARVLDELELPYEQDPTTKRIMEAFPGSRQVAATAAQAAAPAPGRFGGRAAAPAAPQARRAARSVPQETPSRDELWGNLLDYPGRWYDQSQSKRSDGMPDFLSLDYVQADGWPVGLWLQYQGRDMCPDMEALNAIPVDAFAQTRPGRRANG